MRAATVLSVACLSCLTMALPSIAQPVAREGVLKATVLQNNLDTQESSWLPARRYHSIPKRGSADSAKVTAKITQGKLLSAVESQQSSRALYQAFLKMNCQEFVRLDANYYSVNRNYKFLRPQVVEGSSAYLYSDGKHLIAVDPAKYQTWLWEPDARTSSSGRWSKLTHTKF